MSADATDSRPPQGWEPAAIAEVEATPDVDTLIAWIVSRRRWLAWLEFVMPTPANRENLALIRAAITARFASFTEETAQ